MSFSQEKEKANRIKTRHIHTILLLIITVMSQSLFAQSTDKQTDTAKIPPNSEALYSEGLEELNRYFIANFQQGETWFWGDNRTARVVLEFTIEETGELTDLMVRKNTLHMENGPLVFWQLNNDIKGIIQRAPAGWIAARENHKFVRRRYQMVIVLNHPFEIADAELERILPMYPIPFHEAIDPNKHYSLYSVSRMPVFKTGNNNLLSYLSDTAAQRLRSKPKKLKGYVDVEYVIGADASISNFLILKHQGVYPDHLYVAREMIENLVGKWQPARIGDTAVNCTQRHRIYFGKTDSVSNKAAHSIAKENIFKVAEMQSPYSSQRASFRGTSSDLNAIIRQNLLYPKESLKHCVHGYVNVKAVVELDGSLTNFSVGKKRQLGFGCEQQAMKVLEYTNYRWTPAYWKGHFTRSELTIPVHFDIGYSTPDKMKQNEGTGPVLDRFDLTSKAEYKPGLDSLYQKFQNEFDYPLIASTKKDRTEIPVSLIVEKDGSISSIKVLKPELGKYCVQESIQEFLMSTDGNWSPGKKRGVAVRSRVILPFTLIFKEAEN